MTFTALRRAAPAAAATAVLLALSLTAGSPAGASSSRAVSAPAGSHHPHHGSQALALYGDLHTHDPSMIRAGRHGDWFVFSTGDPAVANGTVQVRRSHDLHHWKSVGTVWNEIPAWVRTAVPEVSNIWAPEVFEQDGTYYLYYAASSFGSNRSVIGLATNTTLDPGDPDYAWVDHGLVTESLPDDDYNAIDPAVVEDRDGTPYLAFGSFWSGIRMLKLQWPAGKPVAGQGEPLALADRPVPPNAIEAPYITRNGRWYYLFVSFDFCCRGTDSTYKVAVSRSRSVTGPYVDELGTPLLHGGGTVILSERGDMYGPGGQSVYDGLLVHHYYDGTAGGDFRLGLRRIDWSRDGWPVVTSYLSP